MALSEKTRKELAKRIAEQIIRRMNERPDYVRSSIRVALATHIMLESVADALDIDRAEFKQLCGIGQPLAYFI